MDGIKKKEKCWFKTINTNCTQRSGLVSRQTGDNLNDEAPAPKNVKRLTHQEFDRTFTQSDGVWKPFAEKFLESSSQSSSPGML